MNRIGRNAKESFAGDVAAFMRNASDQKRGMFIEACDDALMFFHEQLAPAVASQNGRISKMLKLAAAARAYDEALDQLDEYSADIIEMQEYMGQIRRGVPRDVAADRAAKLRAGLAASGALAKTLKAYADVLATRKKPNRLDAEDLLITDIALAYDSIFCERPSFSKTGIFQRVATALLRHVGLMQDNAEIGEKRLERIFDKITFRSAAPKRGRKAKQTLKPSLSFKQ